MSATEPGKSGLTLSAKECAMLVCAFRTNKSDFKPDFTVMAEELGYNGAASAATGWNRVRSKILGDAAKGGKGGGAASTKKKEKKSEGTTKKKRGADGDEGKPAPKKHKTVSRYIQEGEDDDEDCKNGIKGEDGDM